MLDFRSGCTSVRTNRGDTGSALTSTLGRTIATRWTEGATAPAAHASNDSVTSAVPGLTEAAARTGPGRVTLQKRCLSSTVSGSGGAPGHTRETFGWTPAGIGARYA